MNPRCPVCRHPMHRTERGSLVCMTARSFAPSRYLCHRDKASVARRIEANWRYDLHITAGAADLTPYTRNWDRHDFISSGDARGQKRNLSKQT